MNEMQTTQTTQQAGIVIGGFSVWGSVADFAMLGLHADGTSTIRLDGDPARSPARFIAIALSEGKRGPDAILRAIALKHAAGAADAGAALARAVEGLAEAIVHGARIIRKAARITRGEAINLPADRD